MYYYIRFFVEIGSLQLLSGLAFKWPPSAILLISSFQVVGITGVRAAVPGT
jgi:hypothetical protein